MASWPSRWARCWCSLIGSLSPIVTLELRGIHTEASLLHATWLTWQEGEHLVAALSAATAFGFPLGVILLRLWVLVPLVRGRPVRALAPVMRLLRWMLRWSMVEVFMLGVLVAVVRSAGVTNVLLGAGIFAYTALTRAAHRHPCRWPAEPVGCGIEGAAMNARVPIAVDRGLIGCDVCALVLRAPKPGPAGVARAAATRFMLASRSACKGRLSWLAVSLVLYVPANLLPVMSTTSVFGRVSHTIGGGIVELWSTGSHELALIVFIASIVVPLGKMGSLALLAFTAQRSSRWRQRERAGLYRLVDTVGHWSMLDVFVVVLLVGMVQFGVLASVEPGPGLLAFGAVVVATMLAASSFDPRLIWPAEPEPAEPAPRG